ncbi:MAG TPA: hypothetical protein VK638_35315 [Edaphobacter sp.]|nr:hypothetical protein [Edaphobacter sp.]
MKFLRSERINRGNFISLGQERDPIIGVHERDGIFTIPKKLVRRRINSIHTFNIMRGGEYLFMPSLSALRWIGSS